MRHLIVTTSHSPWSRSIGLAEALEERLLGLNESVSALHLRDLELPYCDADSCYRDPVVQSITARISESDTITVATPIYNFEVGGATRNLVALTGPAWEGKVVGFVCAAGGHSSYMAIMTLANSLMLDFRCIIVPRFVFATDEAFTEHALTDTDIETRIAELAGELRRFASALGGKIQ